MSHQQFVSHVKTLHLNLLLTLLHSDRPKLYAILAFLSAIGLSYHSEMNPESITQVATITDLLVFTFSIKTPLDPQMIFKDMDDSDQHYSVQT